jgi:hypothetical protein
MLHAPCPLASIRFSVANHNNHSSSIPKITQPPALRPERRRDEGRTSTPPACMLKRKYILAYVTGRQAQCDREGTMPHAPCPLASIRFSVANPNNHSSSIAKITQPPALYNEGTRDDKRGRGTHFATIDIFEEVADSRFITLLVWIEEAS